MVKNEHSLDKNIICQYCLLLCWAASRSVAEEVERSGLSLTNVNNVVPMKGWPLDGELSEVE